MKEPKSYKNNESKHVIEWVAQKLLCFTLLEQNQDLSESRIRNYMASGNWIIKHLEKHKLDCSTTEDYKNLTTIFQKISAETRSNTLNRSNVSNNRTRTIFHHIHNLNLFLSYLFPNDTQIISDHLHHGKQIDSIIDPPSDFCVVETVRYMANLIESEILVLNKTISSLKKTPYLTKNKIASFFKSTKDYRNSFLYLFIAITGINGTNTMLISLADLDISNDKKTSGKSISVYKTRAKRVISFEIQKDFLVKYVKPFVNLFNIYNILCKKVEVSLELDYIGRQIFRKDEKFRHISQYFLFSEWIKKNKPRLTNYLKHRLKQEDIFDHIINIPTPRDLRNYKSTTLETKVGHNLAAIIMQHSPETALKHYYRRQEKEAIKNMGVFYADFENTIKNISNKVKERLSTIPAGQCKATVAQQSIMQLNTTSSAYIVGDCTTPTGCLFCSFFVAHAEEDGIFKLVSMREYILLKNEVISYHSEMESSFGAVIERINKILQHLKDELQEQAVKWIEEAESKVAYELHPDWQELYDMDMSLLES
ncbi:MAG: hypothetical protein GQ532_02370 [Methylomarinum sp.]|nr:hypothetical protein [Methylomarinum sp.]